jgi:acyl-coenzyme A thioesterase PaaI-like protein
VKSVQETYAPNGICFGCGPANAKGLRLRSFVEGDELVARFRPEPHHQAFPNVLNGGIAGSLLDCHCNWAAAMRFMKEQGASEPVPTVTAKYEIELTAPTPTDGELEIRARVVSVERSRALVEGELLAGGRVTARCKGTFVAVKPGHPAYHRWA